MSASTFHTDRAIPRAADATSDTTITTLPGTGALLVRPLTTTVPKELVQRAGVAEVMLTGWERLDDHSFAVAAQWPRGHCFFAVDGRYHPLIATETIRQTAVLLAHAEYGVPLDRRLPVRDVRVSTRPEHFGIGWTPAALELRVAVVAETGPDDVLTGLRVNVEIRRDGHLAATGGGALSCVTAAQKQQQPRPRPQVVALTPPVPPQAVGRRSPMDVVLSPMGRPDRWLLRVDLAHPVFFDRPVDHAPDMMLLEAACQATALTLGRPCAPLDITTDFDRCTELTSPCVIEACRIPGVNADASESVLVTGHQDGRLVFRSAVTVAAG